ncbi:MAG: hypothetical protein EON58_03865 [Alphaproteobacteria bacterium]|nr:MAG: hypothetical protein EON58_03865 [Alphaproteobacteria bacterium]
MSYTNSLDQNLKLGIVQTSLDPASAWVSSTKMEKVEEEQAISEIKAFLSSFRQEEIPPDIILLPELSVPTGFEKSLKNMSDSLHSVIIAGFDYRSGSLHGEVHNEALIIVPTRWRGATMGARASVRRIGKTYAAPEEERKLKSISCTFKHDPSVWIFYGGTIGNFGVMVCYDFLDLERIAMYRGKVHHLFILALNKDATSFRHVAEAVSRMAFCNVVICNCGHFGGSLAISPYRLAERRTIYQHAGARLATAQIIELPVSSIDLHQHGVDPILNGVKEYKSLPPGYRSSISLEKHIASLAALP